MQKSKLLVAALLLPSTAYADVVWPALYLETRMFSWWAIGVGLIVEIAAFYVAFQLPLRKAALAALAANGASSLLGIVLIPVAGLAWEIFPGSLIHYVLEVGTFNPVTWAGTAVMAAVVNALLEGAVLSRWFGIERSRRAFLVLVSVNAVTVGVALASLWFWPVHL